MKIVDISTRVVNADMRNWVFVRVETDQDGPVRLGRGDARMEDHAPSSARSRISLRS